MAAFLRRRRACRASLSIRRLGGLARAVGGRLPRRVRLVARARVDRLVLGAAGADGAGARLPRAPGRDRGHRRPRGSSGRERPPAGSRSRSCSSLVLSFVPPWLVRARDAPRGLRVAAGLRRCDREARPGATPQSPQRRRRPHGRRDRAPPAGLGRHGGGLRACARAQPAQLGTAASSSPSRGRSRAGAPRRRRSSRARASSIRREPLLELVGGWLERGEPVNVAEVAEVLLDRHASVTGDESWRPNLPGNLAAPLFGGLAKRPFFD